ncbi:MAG: DUF3467 domain-containing protein [Bacteroidaceae bacterium]|nr:DUF3467 domain-containing protein [Bacteroidaceae bacterium]
MEIDNQLQIEIKEDVANGNYANLAVIAHSTAEFVMDFICIMPNMSKAQVKSRVIMTPEHAKRFMLALQENVMKYEKQYGNIHLPEQYVGGPRFKGDA